MFGCRLARGRGLRLTGRRYARRAAFRRQRSGSAWRSRPQHGYRAGRAGRCVAWAGCGSATPAATRCSRHATGADTGKNFGPQARLYAKLYRKLSTPSWPELTDTILSQFDALDYGAKKQTLDAFLAQEQTKAVMGEVTSGPSGMARMRVVAVDNTDRKQKNLALGRIMVEGVSTITTWKTPNSLHTPGASTAPPSFAPLRPSG